MKKSGFTLAEVLITLMILGVIAALTVPSLIQNTQKREQIVQLKKGLSMINQAITMHYALEQENLTDIATNTEFVTMLKNRLAVVAEGADWVRTQDGLTYFVSATPKGASCGVTGAAVGVGGVGNCASVIISTLPANGAGNIAGTVVDGEVSSYTTAAQNTADAAGNTASAITGFYQFYAGAERVVPSEKTQELLNAKDASSVKGGTAPTQDEDEDEEE